MSVRMSSTVSGARILRSRLGFRLRLDPSLGLDERVEAGWPLCCFLAEAGCRRLVLACTVLGAGLPLGFFLCPPVRACCLGPSARWAFRSTGPFRLGLVRLEAEAEGCLSLGPKLRVVRLLAACEDLDGSFWFILVLLGMRLSAPAVNRIRQPYCSL